MNKILQFIVFSICLVSTLAAQNPRAPLSSESLDLLRQELMLRELEQNGQQVEKQIAERRYAQYLERQFVAKMNRFAMLWRALAEEYNAKSVFNLKLAGEVAKAFHDLENGEGWPKARR
jgi:hypothetical protein